MAQITACLKCGGKDLDAVFSHKGAFMGTYQCRECGHIGPAVTFDDWASFEHFKESLNE